MHRTAKQTITFIASVSIILLFFVILVVMALPSHNIPTVETPNIAPETPAASAIPQPTPTPTPEPDEIVNVLLLGVDSRTYDVKSRSDTMVLVSYNQTQNTVKMVSMMRDSWVNIPGYGWNRLNAATAYDSPQLLIDTIESNFGVTADYYAQVKFDDFKKIIDIIGGVDVALSKAEIQYINRKLHNENYDWDNDVTAEPGIIHLNGTQALWHCRNRSVGLSDYERTDRQRVVLKAMCQAATDNIDIGMVAQLIPEVIKSVDTNMPLTTLADLAISVLTNGMPEIEDTRLPFQDTFWGANKNGASVLELDMEKNKELLQEFLNSGANS